MKVLAIVTFVLMALLVLNGVMQVRAAQQQTTEALDRADKALTGWEQANAALVKANDNTKKANDLLAKCQ